MESIRVLDLFAGCGGFSLGFHLAGYDIAAHVENNPACLNTLKLNFPRARVFHQDLLQYPDFLMKIKNYLRDQGLRSSCIDIFHTF